MRRLVFVAALALSLTASPVAAFGRHRPSHARVCPLLGIAITFGGDAGEPDLWTYVYRCTDGTKYEHTVIHR